MPKIFPARRRTAVRAAVAALAVALVAAALGALHTGAATPATQSVTVPSKAGRSVAITWSGEAPQLRRLPDNPLWQF